MPKLRRYHRHSGSGDWALSLVNGDPAVRDIRDLLAPWTRGQSRARFDEDCVLARRRVEDGAARALCGHVRRVLKRILAGDAKPLRPDDFTVYGQAPRTETVDRSGGGLRWASTGPVDLLDLWYALACQLQLPGDRQLATCDRCGKFLFRAGRRRAFCGESSGRPSKACKHAAAYDRRRGRAMSRRLRAAPARQRAE